jgi:GT2 family glycosyltransferase
LDHSEVDNTLESRSAAVPAGASILAVVVLYGILPRESSTLRSLQASAALMSPHDAKFKILVYDNTPGGHTREALSDHCQYHVSDANNGLAGAYNFALDMAEEEGFDWLLTLDQDTELEGEYLGRLFQHVRHLFQDDRIAGIAPCVADHGVVISPHSLFMGFSKRFPKHFEGLSERETAAINSATAWRVAALRAIGGFNPFFWLDYLDYWVCHAIHRLGKRIYVDNTLVINHELSLLDKDRRMKRERYANFLIAESAFYDLYKTGIEGLFLTLRISCRLVKQILMREAVQYRVLTWDFLMRRLLLSRKARIEDCRRATRAFAA